MWREQEWEDGEKSIHPHLSLFLTLRLNSTVDLYSNGVELKQILIRSLYWLSMMCICQRWGERGRQAVSGAIERER